MWLFPAVILICTVALLMRNWFTSYGEDKLLMFSMKQSNLYKYLYDQRKDHSPQDIYIEILGLDSDEGEDSLIIGEQTLKLLRENYSSPKQKTIYRDIVKFCIIRKISETPELKNLFSDIVRANLETLLYCALLPEEEKAEVRPYLEKRNWSLEDRESLIECLAKIERAVDTAIPHSY